MKILFLTLYPESVPSTRFRITQYIPFLREDGFETRMMPAIPEHLYEKYSRGKTSWTGLRYYLSEFFHRLGTLRNPPEHDVVVLQKGILSFWLRGMESCLKGLKGRLVFDMDDAVHLAPPHELPRVLRFLRAPDQTRRVIARCDAAVVSNEELAGAIRGWNANVHVIPTPVDTEHFVPQPKNRIPNVPLKLLWTGNRSGNSNVNRMAPIVAALGGRAAAELTVVSDSPDFIRFDEFEEGSIRYVPWSVPNEKACLASADVGVSPIEDNPWNRGKSGFKTMLYMACGLPSVSSPVGSITHVVQHGQNGFFARTTEEWVRALRDLGADESFSAQIGGRARRTIVEKYSAAVLYPQFKRALMGSGAMRSASLAAS